MRGLSRREIILASGAGTLAAVGHRAMLAGLRWLGESFEMTRPGGIVIHHSATEPENQGWMNAAAIEEDHKRRGFVAFHRGRIYHIAYHYVILPDGTLETGRPEGCRGGHTRSIRHNYWTGICLIGWFDPCWDNPFFHRPTPEQMKTLVSLSADLMARHHFPLRRILPHRDVNSTLCPGRSFPWEMYIESMRARAAQLSEGPADPRHPRPSRHRSRSSTGAAPTGDATAAAMNAPGTGWSFRPDTTPVVHSGRIGSKGEAT